MRSVVALMQAPLSVLPHRAVAYGNTAQRFHPPGDRTWIACVAVLHANRYTTGPKFWHGGGRGANKKQFLRQRSVVTFCDMFDATEGGGGAAMTLLPALDPLLSVSIFFWPKAFLDLEDSRVIDAVVSQAQLLGH